MKFSECKKGRTFVIHLEHGDIVHKEIEGFAKKHGIRAASVLALGGADKGSRLIVGPEDGQATPPLPMEYLLEDVHEITGTGTVFPDEEGTPILHMHIASGRGGATITGCIRNGVKVWKTMEIILFELADSSGARVFDPQTGLKLLRP